MHKTTNILFLSIVLIFFWNIYKYYSSNKNMKTKEFNRLNINKISNDKISNLPVLSNNTNNIIEFNNSITDEITNSKPRSFWNLLKSK